MKREEIVALDRQHIWRPYTSSDDQASVDPFVIARAEGAWLYDHDGSAYLDGNSSWWCKNLGHRHPRLIKALQKQCESLGHCSMAQTTHEQAALLAKELADVCPERLERVFYSDDGSTAVEVAQKMAFQYWQQNGHAERKRFVVLEHAFHGETVGCMSASDIADFHKHFSPLLFDVVRVPSDDAGPLVEHLGKYGDQIAAVLVEPMVQGAGGMRFCQADVLRAVREACDKADTFLIADEVFVGYGRSGPMWACEHAGVAPDILCTAKGFSGGMLPFAATVATDRVFEGFSGDKSRALMHGHTFFGNPLGAAIAREVLAIYRDEHVLAGIAEREKMLRAAFESLPGVANPRVLGMIGAGEFGATGYMGRAGWRISEAARQIGLYLRPLGNTVYLCPPLNIRLEDLRLMLDRLAEAVQRCKNAL